MVSLAGTSKEKGGGREGVWGVGGQVHTQEKIWSVRCTAPALLASKFSGSVSFRQQWQRQRSLQVEQKVSSMQSLVLAMAGALVARE